MDCKLIFDMFEKTCIQPVKCFPENYNTNFPVAEALHTQNCIRIMKLKEAYCKSYKLPKNKQS